MAADELMITSHSQPLGATAVLRDDGEVQDALS